MTIEGTLGDFVRPDLRPRSEAPPWQGGAVVKWRKKMEKEMKFEMCFIKSSQKEVVW
jgi:hypothetical protein